MKKEKKQHLVGIIGRSISHTLSPAMHTAAFDALGLPFRFGVFDVEAEYLPALVASFRTQGIGGASVTIPHKERIIPLLDSLDENARMLGAVNAVVNRNGLLTGYNTDVVGIEKTLASVQGKIRNSTALVLGAGGGARAVVYTLSKIFSPARIRLYNRTTTRAQTMIDEFKKIFPKIAYENISDPLQPAIAESTLIVNTTSVGMTPNIDALPVPAVIRFSNQQIIFDIIYTPLETALLRRAKKDGAQTINGVEMLVQQGAAAFELWTGKQFPVEVGRKALIHALTKA